MLLTLGSELFCLETTKPPLLWLWLLSTVLWNSPAGSLSQVFVCKWTTRYVFHCIYTHVVMNLNWFKKKKNTYTHKADQEGIVCSSSWFYALYLSPEGIYQAVEALRHWEVAVHAWTVPWASPPPLLVLTEPNNHPLPHQTLFYLNDVSFQEKI